MIKIAIADDQRLFRQSLRCLLESDKTISVVGEATDGQELFSIMEKAAPDIILMDIEMPKLDGITATKIITGRWPRTKVIMLSVSDDDVKISASMEAGAKGYILKDADKDEFIRIIKHLNEGKTTPSPYLANTLINAFSASRKGEPSSKRILPGEEYGFSEREKEIVSLLLKGKSNKEISDALFISLDTVKTHMRKIFQKLGVANRTEAVVKLLQR